MVCTLSALREIQFGAGIFKIPRRINAFRGGRASGGSERAAIHGEQEIAKPVAAVLAFGRVRGFGKGRNRLRRLVARTPLEYQLPETELYAGLCFSHACEGGLPFGFLLQIIIFRHGHRGKDAEDDQNRNDFNKSKARSALRCRHADSPHKRVRRRV